MQESSEARPHSTTGNLIDAFGKEQVDRLAGKLGIADYEVWITQENATNGVGIVIEFTIRLILDGCK